MTINGWIGFVLLAICILGAGIFGVVYCDSVSGKILSGLLSVIVCVGVLLGMLWYFNCTASGQRAITDQKSDFANGLNRTVTVYTADGNVIAQYEGKIDIDMNDGGYVKFDFEGKRYIYYNCFVESIADIG